MSCACKGCDLYLVDKNRCERLDWIGSKERLIPNCPCMNCLVKMICGASCDLHDNAFVDFQNKLKEHCLKYAMHIL